MNSTPVEESLVIRQRLRNLCELAIAIGQKKGLLGNHNAAGANNVAGGQDVDARSSTRDSEASPAGPDKAGDRAEG